MISLNCWYSFCHRVVFVKNQSTLGFILDFYFLTKLNLLSAGLKYQDTAVSTINKEGPKSSVALDRATIWETIAPDMLKKKPAYAHSLINGNRGTSTAITPKIF